MADRSELLPSWLREDPVEQQQYGAVVAAEEDLEKADSTADSKRNSGSSYTASGGRHEPSWIKSPINYQQRDQSQESKRSSSGDHARFKSNSGPPSLAKNGRTSSIVDHVESNEHELSLCPIDSILFYFRAFHFFAGCIALACIIANISAFYYEVSGLVQQR